MKLSAQARRMMQVILLIAAVAAVISLFYYRSREVIPFLLGLLLGTVTSVLRVLLLEHIVNRIISAQITSKKQAKSFVQFSHLGRLALAFVALLIGATVEGISLLGVVVGIFSYQIGTYALHPALKPKQQRQAAESVAQPEPADRLDESVSEPEEEN